MYKIPANTLFMGNNVIFVPECHSTNTLALQQTFESEGTVVITSNQTAGRGQRGNTWEAEPGKNLTFSIVLKPGFLSVKDQFYLNITISLAIRDYLQRHTTPDIFIKWPNDILVQGKKICGILIESQIQGEKITKAVVGIGLNINQLQFRTDTATSLTLISNKVYLLHEELETLLVCIEQRYLQLKQLKFKDLKADYLASLFGYKKQRLFEDRERQFHGVIMDIDEYGRLVVDIAGEQRTFGIKEISFR